MSEIRFEQVTKQYSDDAPVIDDLNLHIKEGEFMVLVGPSGCAKSTTLRMIAGLETITRGELFIGGTRANDLTPAERNISMVFQSYALFPNMTVEQNLSFGMQIRKQPTDLIRSEVLRIAEMLDLTQLLQRKPRQLSGGQAQRVALGRAMIRHPSAFLFDEPLSNLDAELRVQMRGEISELQKTLGTTTVYVTHDQVEAMTLGHRIAVMNKGKIMQVGSPTELYDNPDNDFVAGFIGSPRMNMLPIEGGQLLGNKIAATDCNRENLKAGIRPEKIVIDSSSDTSRDGITAEGMVTRLEDLGHEVLVQIVIPETDQNVTLRTSSDVRGQIVNGNRLRFHVKARDVVIFDASSGDRIR